MKNGNVSIATVQVGRAVLDRYQFAVGVLYVPVICLMFIAHSTSSRIALYVLVRSLWIAPYIRLISAQMEAAMTAVFPFVVARI